MKKIKAIVLSLLIGSVITLNAQEHHEMKNHNVEKETHKLEELKADLDLSEAQVDQLRTIYEERREKMKTSHPDREEMKEMTSDERKSAKIERMKWRKEMNSETEAKISKVLNADQFERYTEIKNDRKEKRKEWREHKHRNDKLNGTDQEEKHRHMHEKGEKHEH